LLQVGVDLAGYRVRSGYEPGGSQEDATMADKSPKKSTAKTVASKSLKEKRADKKDKAASKRKD
jgi:hypothetical protein